MSGPDLAGLRVLVTRPAHQADELRNAIDAAQGNAIPFPVLEIIPKPADELQREVATLPPADIVVFVSANAVRAGFAAFANSTAKIAAVGPATAQAIDAAGGTVDIVPNEGFDSDHLLATAALHAVANKSIVIVRGQSGRELLAKTLRHRGADVHYVGAYRRATRSVPAAELERINRAWQHDEIDAVVIMSVATLDALIEVLPAASRDPLRRTPLVAPSERVIQTALERLPGVSCIHSAGPLVDDILQALAACRHNEQHDRIEE